jgi:hypothetical protein
MRDLCQEEKTHLKKKSLSGFAGLTEFNYFIVFSGLSPYSNQSSHRIPDQPPITFRI